MVSAHSERVTTRRRHGSVRPSCRRKRCRREAPERSGGSSAARASPRLALPRGATSGRSEPREQTGGPAAELATHDGHLMISRCRPRLRLRRDRSEPQFTLPSRIALQPRPTERQGDGAGSQTIKRSFVNFAAERGQPPPSPRSLPPITFFAVAGSSHENSPHLRARNVTSSSSPDLRA
jgi:hypothetical protein